MLLASGQLIGAYDYRLVALSVLIASIASYTALDLAGRLTISTGTTRLSWLAGGASAMGLGVWSMHYIGMLAFKLPLRVEYDWRMVLVSLAAAIVASAAALYVTSAPRMSTRRAAIGSIAMGGGIGAMHYIGMYAMRMGATCHFDLLIVVLSVILAVLVSFIALRVLFIHRNYNDTGTLRKIFCAIGLGAAIPTMHYTGMAAATFTLSDTAPNMSYAVPTSTLGIVGIVLMTSMVLGIAILTTAYSRLQRETRTPRRRLLSVRIRTVRATMFTFCIMAVFQEGKQILHPRAVLWMSHVETILCAMLVVAVLGFTVLGKEEQFRSELAVSEKQYRSLFERSLAGVYRTSLDGRFLDCNYAFSQMFGYASPEEMLGHRVSDIYLSSSDRDIFTANLRSRDSLANFECRLRRKDGSVIWVLENATLLPSEDGAEPVFEGTVTDITEQKRAAEALQKSEIHYRMLFDSNPLPMWVFARSTLKFLAVNEAAIRHYGFSRSEFLAMTIMDIRPEGDIPILLADIEKRIRGLQEAKAWRHRRKDGKIIDVEIVSHDLDFHGIEAELVAAYDITERKKSEEMLHDSENKYRVLFEESADANWLMDEKGFLHCNLAALQMFGYNAADPMIHPADISPPNQSDGVPSRAAAEQKITDAFIHGKNRFEWLHQRKNGDIFPAEVCLTALTLSGKPALLATVRDVTERKQFEETLLFKTALLEAQAETTIDGILAVDESDHVVLANKQFGLNFGIPDEVLKTRDDRILRGFVVDKVEDPEAFVERIEHLSIHRDEKSRDELKFKNGKTFDRYSAPLVDSKEQYRGRIWYFRDITDRKVAEERVQYLAYYDALTGLPNRTLVQDRLTTALAGARRRKEKVAVLFLDIDRFKVINDSLGHSCGDLVLQEAADRLKRWARQQDTVARLGGDEFLVVLTNLNVASDAAVATERLMDALAAEFVIQGQSISITGSLGISIFPEHGSDVETLIKNADAAMYSAKDSGRSNFRFFTEEMNAQAVERLTLECRLRHALEKQELFLLYQPQMNLATGTITGLEALLRWQHPELGIVPPDKFIPIAENNGLIVPIGEWVLRSACSQASKWQDEGLLAVPVAVNVSAVQFRQEGFCTLVRKILHENHLHPKYLELELTESLLLSNADVMFSVFRELKDMGLKLAIDDFGTGYSSLSYLKQFPVGKLKIDRSFIRDVAVNGDDAAITAAIISMAKSLSLKVIAEGVENEAQMSFLRAHKCDEIQGYYFSKPLLVSEIPDKLRVNNMSAFSATAGSD
jgi:diguanylate cyclase (GGDEF)-like protein/PAS domain S-box-containing protein